MPTAKVKGVTIKKTTDKTKTDKTKVTSRPNSGGRMKKMDILSEKDKVKAVETQAAQPFKVLDNMDSICRKCKLIIDEAESNSIDCDRCHGWLHFACSGMSDLEFDFLHKHKVTMKFHCDICTSELTEGTCHNAKHTQMEAQMNNLTGLVNILINQNKIILEKLDKKVETTTPAPLVWPTVETRLERNIEAKMTQVVQNQKEVDEKRGNLIIFNLPEADQTPDGKQEKREDMEQAIDVLSYIDNQFEGHDIREANVTRIGYRRKGENVRSRPIKVELDDTATRDRVLRNAFRLKDYVVQRVGVSHDKTTQEIQADITLKQRLSDMRKENPLADYIIYDKDIKTREAVAEIKQKKHDAWKARQVERGIEGGNSKHDN